MLVLSGDTKSENCAKLAEIPGLRTTKSIHFFVRASVKPGPLTSDAERMRPAKG